MNIWTRVCGLIDTADVGGITGAEAVTDRLTLGATLQLFLYPSEAAARQGQERYGGIVMEVSAASLREQIENKDSVLLGGPGREGRGSSPTQVYVSAIYTGIPHTWDEEEGVAKFGEVPWFAELERELGIEFIQ